MSLFPERFGAQETVARSGFFACAVSFVGFLCAEAVRPGFASNYFSVHWFLIGAVLFGLWWAVRRSDGPDRAVMQYAAAVLLCIAFAAAAWSLGEGLKEFRPLVSLIALLAPVIVLKIVRDPDK